MSLIDTPKLRKKPDMRGAAWVLSMLLHIIAFWLAVFNPDFSAFLLRDNIKIIDVDLSEFDEPLPMDRQLTPDEVAAAMFEKVDLSSMPPPRSKIKNISEIKSPYVNSTEEAVDIYFGRGYLKQGNEIRMTLRTINNDMYSKEDFLGYYTILGEENHFVRVVDAREKYGHLVFIDQRDGMVRALFETGQFIYSYGPSFLEKEPIQGSVLFMPKDQNHRKGYETPNRLSWVHNDRPARFGKMIYMDEQDVTVPLAGGEGAKGVLVLPLSDGPHPAVLWLPGGSGEMARAKAAVKALASRGVAVLILETSGAGEEDQVYAGSEGLSSGDVQAALAFLREQKELEPARIGLWASGQDLPLALRVAGLESGPSFVVAVAASVQVSPQELALPGAGELASIKVPVFWIFSAPEPDQVWAESLAALRALADQGKKDFRVVTALRQDLAQDDEQERTDERESWRESLASGYIRLAAPWLFSDEI